VKDKLKNLVEFHQTQWDRHKSAYPKEAEYHKGAIMAFSKCLMFLEESTQADEDTFVITSFKPDEDQ
jgi:hypothetical protein